MYERNGQVLLDPVGTILPLFLVLLLALLTSNSRLPVAVKRLVYGALALRVIGAFARYFVLFGVYNGSGDARGYYGGGLYYASELWNFSVSEILNPANMTGGKWWGTHFMYFPSTLVHAVIGPSMPGGFIVFSLFAFLGLCGFVVAFRRCYPHIPVGRYARWVWFFPALWFWPSSIGKEAVILCGLGLAVAGYIGKNGRVNWLLLAVGLFIVFGIRPEVAAVTIASMLFAHWLSLISERWTVGNTIQAALLIGIGCVGLYYSTRTMGIASFDVEGVQEYMEGSSGRRLGGGSQIEAVDVGIAGIPGALVNIIFRPFIWEARGLMIMITSIEIMAVWVIAWTRRDIFINNLRRWRHDRLVRLAIPFILLYSISLGMVLSNMGIIARQRILIFPFVFILFEATPHIARAVGPRYQHRQPVLGRPSASVRSPTPARPPIPMPRNR